ncbi:helix-turn-helix domain-containing protein, partial [Thermodesulfobacteriota bacterium]
PMAYLKRARLNDVRKMLRRATPGKIKVSDIANQRGFWHMGQLAEDYHQLFRELPSETLRKT